MAGTGVIRLDDQGLRQASGKLHQQGGDLETLIGQMDKVVRSLPDSWEGAAARAYVQQFDDLKPGLKEARELVEKIATQIDKTLKAAQDLDSNIANQLKV